MSKTMSAKRWIYLKHQWELSQAEVAAIEDYAAYVNAELRAEVERLKKENRMLEAKLNKAIEQRDLRILWHEAEPNRWKRECNAALLQAAEEAGRE